MYLEQVNPPFGNEVAESGQNGGCGSSRIATFLRLRPSPHASPRIVVDGTESSVEFRVPRDTAAGCDTPHTAAMLVQGQRTELPGQ